MNTEIITVVASTAKELDIGILSLILYSVLVVVLITTLYQWHKGDKFKDFTLIDLFAENGKISARKFFESIAFILTSVAFMLHVVKSGLSEGMLLSYAGLWIVGRSVGQIIHVKKENSEGQ